MRAQRIGALGAAGAAAVLMSTGTPALAAGHGRLLAHRASSGSASVAGAGWGPRILRSVSRPASFTVVVRAKLRKGYFCQSDCNQVNVQWDVACSKPGRVSSHQGGMFGRPPRTGHPRLPFSHPRRCSINVMANANLYVGGRIEIWVYYRR